MALYKILEIKKHKSKPTHKKPHPGLLLIM